MSRTASASNSANQRPLRLGLLLSKPISKWQHALIERVSQIRDVDITVLITVMGPAVEDVGATRHALASFLFRQIDKLDIALSKRISILSDSDESADISGRFPTTDIVLSRTLNGGTFGTSDVEIERIAKLNLDVLIDLGIGVAADTFVTCARDGVWALRYGEQGKALGSGLEGFWDWHEGRPYTSVRLERRIAERPLPDTLCNARYKTYRFLWNEHRWRLLERSAWLILDALCEFAAGTRRAPKSHPTATAGAPRRRFLTTTDVVSATARWLSRAARQVGDCCLFDYQWGIYLAPLEDPGAPPAIHGSPLFPSRDRLWADPFVVHRDGQMFVFVEELLFSQNRGKIVCLRFCDGRLAEVIPALEREYHLSYPCLFEHEDELYMVPETVQARTIELYRCVQFPGCWELVRRIMTGIRCVDTSIHRVGEHWWLLTNPARSRLNDHSYELDVYYSDHPIEGRWWPHPRNPVVRDAEHARNAGGLLKAGNTWIRACQGRDNEIYGSNLCLREVTTLSVTDYEERPLHKIYPKWQPGLVGTHHLSHGDGIAVIDVLRRRLRFLRGR